MPELRENWGAAVFRAHREYPAIRREAKKYFNVCLISMVIFVGYIAFAVATWNWAQAWLLFFSLCAVFYAWIRMERAQCRCDEIVRGFVTNLDLSEHDVRYLSLEEVRKLGIEKMDALSRRVDIWRRQISLIYKFQLDEEMGEMLYSVLEANLSYEEAQREELEALLGEIGIAGGGESPPVA